MGGKSSKGGKGAAVKAARANGKAVAGQARVVTAVDGFPGVGTGATVLGEIVSWDFSGMVVPFSLVRSGLAAAGLDPDLAKDMLPRNAFARASRALAERRLIDRVSEDDTYLRFQLSDRQYVAETEATDAGDDTTRPLTATRIDYQKCAALTLDKSTGAITGDDQDIVQRAQTLFAEQMGVRKASDLTTLIKRLFVDKRRADMDLIPMSSYANFYFVRQSRIDFVQSVQTFIEKVGGYMLRLPIASGTVQGASGVRDAVESKMASLVAELREAIAEFGAATGNVALQHAAERVKVLRFKIQSYATYLGDRQAAVQDSLKEAEAELRQKVQEIAQARQAASQDAEEGTEGETETTDGE